MRDSNPLHIVLICLFLVCEFLATVLWPAPVEPYRGRLIAAGLMFYAAALLW